MAKNSTKFTNIRKRSEKYMQSTYARCFKNCDIR